MMRTRTLWSFAVALACVPILGCGFNGPTAPSKPVSLTLISSDVPKAVSKDSNTPTTSTLTVAGLDGSLTDVQVSVNVSGAPICDLGMVIQHPDGTKIPLLVVGDVPTTFQCGPSFTSLNTTFPTRTPTPGAPDLKTLLGKPAAGTWILIVTDERKNPGNSHYTINAWMLLLTAQK
jgi:subtilisin-like proprotein convertase family protein